MKTLNNVVEVVKHFGRFFLTLIGGTLGLLVSVAIIALNIYVSFNHTLELYRSAGFSHGGLMDFCATLALELVFVSGSVINIVNIKNGKHWKERIASTSVGIAGIALIMWSNISALWGHGVTGVILGIITPLSIIGFEFILAEVYAKKDRKEDPIIIARIIKSQTGKLPSIRKLAGVAQISEHKAKKALKELRRVI